MPSWILAIELLIVGLPYKQFQLMLRGVLSPWKQTESLLPWILTLFMLCLLAGGVRTAAVCGGHFRLGGTLVKLLQQELVDGSLVVPLATLDSELQPNNDANDVLQYVLLGVEIVEPAVHSVRQNTYI